MLQKHAKVSGELTQRLADTSNELAKLQTNLGALQSTHERAAQVWSAAPDTDYTARPALLPLCCVHCHLPIRGHTWATETSSTTFTLFASLMLLTYVASWCQLTAVSSSLSNLLHGFAYADATLHSCAFCLQQSMQ